MPLHLLHWSSKSCPSHGLLLDKNPGVGEIPGRITAKAVLSIIKGEILDAAGSSQLCAGQISGINWSCCSCCEAMFRTRDTEAVLLVDASNAFNSLNRTTALQNIMRLCPSFATILINTYRSQTDLFIDGDVLLSQLKVTHWRCLCTLLQPYYWWWSWTSSLVCSWCSSHGGIDNLKEYWDQLCTHGPAFGYNVNASKSWLITISLLEKPLLKTQVLMLLLRVDPTLGLLLVLLNT